MCGHDGEFAASLLEIFVGYDMAAAMRSAAVPIRAINGDLYPTNIEGNRRHAPDYDALVLQGVGHSSSAAADSGARRAGGPATLTD